MGRYYDAALAIRATMDAAGAMLTDEQAVEVSALYRPWTPDGAYTTGERRTFGGLLYRCLQGHDGQAGWTPEAAPSLWAQVLIPDPSVTPEWVQPESTNPYMQGDRVTHNGKTWVSDIDNNVWAPGVYGWTEVA